MATTLKMLPAPTMNRFHAENVARLRGWLTNETHKDANGVLRWDANNAVVPVSTFKDAFVEMPAGHEAAYNADVAKSLAAYHKAQRNHKPSAEEMYEMRAAFGPGQKVVNVITGRVTRT